MGLGLILHLRQVRRKGSCSTGVGLHAAIACFLGIGSVARLLPSVGEAMQIIEESRRGEADGVRQVSGVLEALRRYRAVGALAIPR